VAVLGYVGHPGSYPLLTFGTRITQIIATAGGVSQTGSNKVILSGVRNGKPFLRQIDITAIYEDGQVSEDVQLAGGDSIFVPKAEMFYIYGEVNRPGQYPLERHMTVMQALAAGGGPTVRGSENRVRLNRRAADGKVTKYSPELSDLVQQDDVIYVNESFF
jgi:polysaccharide export outer membrane protein